MQQFDCDCQVTSQRDCNVVVLAAYKPVSSARSDACLAHGLHCRYLVRSQQGWLVQEGKVPVGPSPALDEMAALEVMELTPAPVPSGFAFLGERPPCVFLARLDGELLP